MRRHPRSGSQRRNQLDELRREFRGVSLWREGADVSPRTVVKPASVKQEPEREAFALCLGERNLIGPTRPPGRALRPDFHAPRKSLATPATGARSLSSRGLPVWICGPFVLAGRRGESTFAVACLHLRLKEGSRHESVPVAGRSRRRPNLTAPANTARGCI